MRTFALTLLGVAVLLGGTMLSPASAQTPTEPPTAAELLECARANWVEGTFHGLIRLELFRPDYSKTYRLEVWTEGADKALIRVLEPEEDAGSGYLRVGDDLWYYHPDVGQAISLPPSALSESFLGADASLEDLYRGTLSENYNVELLGSRPPSEDESTSEGDRIYRLRLLPKPDAPVVYGKLELDVRGSDCAILVIDYYDQRETLIREAKFSEFVQVGAEERERVVPTVMTFDDFLIEGSRTIETLESYELDIEIPEERFTLDCLVDGKCGSS
jgi:outer membrane lipoprotein-sorting protein